MISVSTGQIPYETMLDYIFKAVTRFSYEYQIVAPVRKYTHRATRFFVIFSFTMFVHKLRETTSAPTRVGFKLGEQSVYIQYYQTFKKKLS